MTESTTSPTMNWQSFAQEAMDLWQAQLAATAADPKAKEEMARMMTPFGQMFADWSATMQQAQNHARNDGDATPPASNGNSGDVPEDPRPAESDETRSPLPEHGCGSVDAAPVEEQAQQYATAPNTGTANNQKQAPSSGGPIDSDSDSRVVQLAARVAELEQMLVEHAARITELEKSDQRSKRNALLAARAQALRAADGKA